MKFLQIKNYRSYENETFFFKKLNLFYGENNTGKTSLMNLINTLVREPKINFSNTFLGSFTFKELANDENKPIEIMISVDLNTVVYFKLKPQENHSPMINEYIDINSEEIEHFSKVVIDCEPYSNDSQLEVKNLKLEQLLYKKKIFDPFFKDLKSSFNNTKEGSQDFILKLKNKVNDSEVIFSRVENDFNNSNIIKNFNEASDIFINFSKIPPAQAFISKEIKKYYEDASKMLSYFLTYFFKLDKTFKYSIIAVKLYISEHINMNKAKEAISRTKNEDIIRRIMFNLILNAVTKSDKHLNEVWKHSFMSGLNSRRAMSTSYIGPFRKTFNYSYSIKDLSLCETDQMSDSYIVKNLSENEVFKNKITKFLKKSKNLTDLGFERIYSKYTKGTIVVPFYKKNNKKSYNLSTAGSGISQIIPILLSLIDNNKRIIFVEQPELHLHPKLQSDLAEYITNLMYNPSSQLSFDQIFIETHSKYFLDRIMSVVHKKELAIFSSQNQKDPIETLKEFKNLSSFSDVAIYYLYNNSIDNDSVSIDRINLKINGKLDGELKNFLDFFAENARNIIGI